MHDEISLTTLDGRSVELPARRIVGIYRARFGSIVAVERHVGSEWSEIPVGDETGVVFQKWRDARQAGVSCLEDWLASN